MFGYSRATNGFDSRKHCDKRRYEYVLPEWAFDPRRGQGRAAAVREASAAAAAEGAAAAAAEGGAQADGQGSVEQQAAAPAAVAQHAQTCTTAGAVGDAGAHAAAAVKAEPESLPAGAAATAAALGAAQEAAAEEEPGGTQDADDVLVDGAAGGDTAGPAAAAAALPGATADGAFVFDDACSQRLTQILSIVSVAALPFLVLNCMWLRLSPRMPGGVASPL